MPVVEQGNFNIRNEEIEAALRELATTIAARCPAGWGFALQLFEHGEHGAMFYAANAERADIMKMMREFINRNTQ